MREPVREIFKENLLKARKDFRLAGDLSFRRKWTPNIEL